ncbi:MAG: hypothetical protein F4174_01160 [Acidobacteria bacterium]|nr:hypothetical protein [Acidobacteriota bacterium]
MDVGCRVIHAQVGLEAERQLSRPGLVRHESGGLDGPGHQARIGERHAQVRVERHLRTDRGRRSEDAFQRGRQRSVADAQEDLRRVLLPRLHLEQPQGGRSLRRESARGEDLDALGVPVHHARPVPQGNAEETAPRQGEIAVDRQAVLLKPRRSVELEPRIPLGVHALELEQETAQTAGVPAPDHPQAAVEIVRHVHRPLEAHLEQVGAQLEEVDVQVVLPDPEVR